MDKVTKIVVQVAMDAVRWIGSFALEDLLPFVSILAVGILVIFVVLKITNKALSKTKLEKAAYSLITTAIRIVLYLLLGLILASRLGIDVTGVVALASVLTLAISLAVQNALTNVVSGFMLLCTRPFSSSDYVEIAGKSGSVSEIGLTYTKLATPDNKYIYIPNSAVTSAEIVNYTVLGKRRVDVQISVSYTNAVQDVLDALKEAGQVPGILPEEGVFAALQSYGESTMNYTVRVWCKTEDYWTTTFAINENIKTVFEQRGVTMSYPHLNIHVQK